MIATGIIRAARAVVRAPAVLGLSLAAASFVLAGCGAARTPYGQTLPATISFENSTNGVVRVYVMSETSEWLLGRVEPAQTARLRLPSGFNNPDEPLQISAVPLAATGRWGTRLTGRNGYAISPAYPLRQLVASRWGIAGQQIYTNVLR
jgi:hypothetical protein